MTPTPRSALAASPPPTAPSPSPPPASSTPNTLAQILAALPPTGTYELCCHPGYNDPDLDRITTRLRTHRNIEREALLAIQNFNWPVERPVLSAYTNLT